ncbi:MAG: diguanylate cyclase [Lachnospiraceae bacterium]|nr:diguanylate cyclase [Lachnospiraceae bacterium]
MKKIMVVDDEKISLMMTSHILSTKYQVCCASSGREAIELYKSEQPDMVLSDLRMKGMSGFELQRSLQETCADPVPFMFMTADSDENIEGKGFENGAMDFIRKPFRADVLLSRVDKILQTMERIHGLKKAAYTDSMTGLLNKTSAQMEINSLCSQNVPGVLMMIDLDSFKLVNDLYGHSMGDKVLIRFAEIICSALRSTDIVGRFGGDEFIAFCRNVSDEAVIAQKADYISEHLLRSAKDFMGEDMTIPLGVSIGCVFSPGKGSDFSTLYKKADRALYYVKEHGKHGMRFFYEDNPPEKTTYGLDSDFSDCLMILGERNPSTGAYTLPFEQFRVIYRFLVRLRTNYKKEVWILFLSLSESVPGQMSAETASEKVLDVLRSSLRQGDVITRNNKNQFMVLLLETTRLSIEHVVTERIMNNFSDSDVSDCYSLTWKLELMN